MTLKPPSLTIGIEEEYQIIDPVTRELKSYITEILKEDVVLLGEVKPELHQSMVEVGTKICRTPAEARSELIRLRGLVMGLAAKNGLAIVAAGSHPFSSWQTQEITPLERYIGVREDLQELAQRLTIRHVPEISFRLDESIARGARVLDLLKQVEKEAAVPVSAESEREESD